MPIELPNEFYPLLADYDPSDLQSYRSVWMVFRELPEFSRNLLTSDELPLALRDLSIKFDFAQSTTMFVSVMVRKMIFREWDEEQSRAELVAWCQEFDPKNAARSTEIFSAVKSDILTIIPQEGRGTGEETKRTTVRMALLEALSLYPQLGQQTITETRIKLKASVELVRGSLINWLKCYREELGVGYHDAMLRGQFLFRSQNGIRLTDEEHGRIGIILRSIEDREAVEIDTEHQTMVFPPYSGPKSPQSEQQEVLESEVPVVSVASFPSKVAVIDGGRGSHSGISQTGVPSQAFNETGSQHVLNDDSPFPPLNQTLGTLHFSSKQVLPVEKEVRPGNATLGSTARPTAFPSGERLEIVTQVTSTDSDKSLPQTIDSGPIISAPSLAPRPALAPKRDMNLNYIPRPFRIDPAKREQPERE